MLNMIGLTPLLSLVLPLACSYTPTTPTETPGEATSRTAPESRSPELVVIYDNNPYDSRLRTAHGFSFLVRLAQRSILFDTGGDSSTLLYNMKQLQIDPGEINAVVLSHIDGHYDLPPKK